MKHVFIIGSKGIPAKYGGFETFVDKLVSGKKTKDLHYFVACMTTDKQQQQEQTTYHQATCFPIYVPNIGPAKAVYYDIKAFLWCLNYIKSNHIKQPIVYVLACRIGPFIWYLKKKLKRLQGRLLVNPDGHEWKRAKWNYWIRKYWKYSERLMVKQADLLVCDSRKIEQYINEDYRVYNPKTTFIAYGTEKLQTVSEQTAEKLQLFYQKHHLDKDKYYLVVGRFVPENNYETMIKEFMNSDTQKDFVIVTNVEENKFYKKLEEETHFKKDTRIKFVGTIYDAQLLSAIRQNAFAYFHGHEVGGTNPSLLEALATTKLNLLIQVGFNEEVAKNGALYWDKTQGNLSNLIHQTDLLTQEQRENFAALARDRMDKLYSWNQIIDSYETLFLES